MSFFKADNTGALKLDDAGLKAFAARNLGEDYLEFRDKQFLESITKPTDYLTNRSNFRKTFYDEASETYAKTFKKLYNDVKMPLEIAQQEALRLSRRELDDKIRIVDSVYPARLGDVASDSLFNQSVIADNNRYNSSAIRNAEQVGKPVKKRKAGKRKAGKGKGKH